MAFDFNIGGAGVLFKQWIITPLFWLLLIFAIIGGLFLILYIRKRRSLKYVGIEKTEYGFNTGVKCGWFGINSYLNGLWTTGREVMKTLDGEIIEEFSEKFFVEVDGNRGILFYRDPLNRKLFPLSGLKVENSEIVSKIPPAEYIDASLRIIQEADQETKDWKDKLLMWGAVAGIIIFALIAVILITQMVKNGQKEASDLILEAGKTCLENSRSICSEIIKSNAPVSSP
jgi:hypothetical protein